METDSNQKSFFNSKLGAVLLVVLVVVFFIIYSSYKNKQIKIPTEIIPQTAKTLTDGSLIEKFPKELILMKDAKIIDSKLLTGNVPNKVINTVSASYTTKFSIQEVFKKYTDYMKKAGYVVTKTDINDSRSIIFAVRKENSLSLIINKNGKETNVGLFLTAN